MKCASCGSDLSSVDASGLALLLCPNGHAFPRLPGSDAAAKTVRRRGTRTTCAAGHPHASKWEATCCPRAYAEAERDGCIVFRAPRLPCFGVGPDPSGQPYYVTPDWALAKDHVVVRIIDAKPRAKAARSRDWRRGRALLEASYGVTVEEWTP